MDFDLLCDVFVSLRDFLLARAVFCCFGDEVNLENDLLLLELDVEQFTAYWYCA